LSNRKESEAAGRKKLTKQQEKAGKSKTDKKKEMQAKRQERKGGGSGNPMLSK
jgi:hypothetical protein